MEGGTATQVGMGSGTRAELRTLIDRARARQAAAANTDADSDRGAFEATVAQAMGETWGALAGSGVKRRVVPDGTVLCLELTLDDKPGSKVRVYRKGETGWHVRAWTVAGSMVFDDARWGLDTRVLLAIGHAEGVDKVA